MAGPTAVMTWSWLYVAIWSVTTMITNEGSRLRFERPHLTIQSTQGEVSLVKRRRCITHKNGECLWLTV